MGERGDKQREIAAAEREHAAVLRAIAQNTADAAFRADLEKEASERDELAAMYEAVADMYDRDDDPAV